MSLGQFFKQNMIGMCSLTKISMCSSKDWYVLYSRLACAILKIGMCSTQDWHVLYPTLACTLPNNQH